MAFSSNGYGSSSSSSNMLPSTMKADRQKERHRRMELEQQEEQPSFPEPRLVTARQDSLTRSLQTVLGDMSDMCKVIMGGDANIWLGTSRTANAAATNTTAAAAARSSSKGKRSTTDALRSGDEAAKQRKPKPTAPSSDGVQQSGTASSLFSPDGHDTNCRKSSSTSSGRHHSSKHRSSRAAETSWKHDKGKTSKNVRSAKVEAGDGGAGSEDEPSSFQATSKPSAEQVRERLQSVDMPGAVEDIFQEMDLTNMEEPLSEIQTPNIGHMLFKFTKSEASRDEGFTSDDRENDHVEVSTHIDGMSDTESSDDDSDSNESEEEDEEQDADANKWLLGSVWGLPDKPSGDAKKEKSYHRNTSEQPSQHDSSGNDEASGSGRGRNPNHTRHRGLPSQPPEARRPSPVKPSRHEHRTKKSKAMTSQQRHQRFSVSKETIGSSPAGNPRQRIAHKTPVSRRTSVKRSPVVVSSSESSDSDGDGARGQVAAAKYDTANCRGGEMGGAGDATRHRSHDNKRSGGGSKLYRALWVHVATSPHVTPRVTSQSQPATTADDDDRCAQQVTAQSTGSETDKPIRRAKDVRVMAAASTSGCHDHTQRLSPQQVKRKLLVSDPLQPQDFPKRSKLHQPTPPAMHAPSPLHTRSEVGGRQVEQDENKQWKQERRKTEGSPTPPNQPNFNPGPINTRHPSVSTDNHESSASDKPSHSGTIVSEPDSSWPEQERLLKSDQYMREGKRLKHEGDGLTDSRTGRTRNGEALCRALVYFEASLCFVMNGYMLEVENGNERTEGSPSHSATSMYQQTISLLDYIRKMRPHGDQENMAFRRLTLSCLRGQALLHLRVYKLKKDIAVKYSEILTEQFKQCRVNRTPSPWHYPVSSGQSSVRSPISPAVPSPYGVSVPGPSPAAGSAPTSVTAGFTEPVSSSTQVSRTSPSVSGSMGQSSTPAQLFPSKIYEMYKMYHSIMNNLMQAHEKWDQAENQHGELADFFRNVDTLSGRSLMLHSSLRDMVTYHKVVLHQLRALYVRPASAEQ